MGQYRLSRNVEASIIEHLRTALFDDGWEGIGCEKSMKQEQMTPPLIMINVVEMDTQKREIGSGFYLKYPTVVVRIFATSDGQREDLADWVLEKFEDNISYYQYGIFDGKIASKELAGNIVIRKILRNEKELANTEPSNLEKEDRYRHIISFSIFVGEL
jgi:hypothetical protein